MKAATRILLVIAIVCLAGTVHAQSPSWRYVEGGYGNWNPDRGDTQDGPFVGAAFDLGKIPIHFIGEFGSFDDVDIFQIGGGWHGLLGEKADLFADGTFYDIDVDDGFKVRFGARWMVSQAFELNGCLAWTELDFSDNKSAAVNGLFVFGGGRFAAGGGFEWGDNWSSARILFRFNFGGKN